MPRHILVNATNLTGAGALGVGLSLIPALARAMPDSAFLLLLPARCGRISCVSICTRY